MKHTRLLWILAGTAALVSTVIFLIGFIYGVQTVVNPKGVEPKPGATEPPSANVPAAQDKLQILALGDSLTKGVGDETGEGYVGKVKRALEKDAKKPVFVWNFAVNGALTTQLLSDLEAKSSADQVGRANIILLTIGGNDLNHLAEGSVSAQNVPNVESLELNYDEVNQRMPEALDRLERIIAKLSGLNPAARIVYVGLYNPYSDLDPKGQGAALIAKWNYSAALIGNKYPNVTVVPTYDLFQTHQEEWLYSDHFHPNAIGYDKIAGRVVQLLK